MSDSGECCACINVKYQPVEHRPGTFSERWACLDCGSAFIRKAASDYQLAAATERAEEAEKELSGARQEIVDLTTCFGPPNKTTWEERMKDPAYVKLVEFHTLRCERDDAKEFQDAAERERDEARKDAEHERKARFAEVAGLSAAVERIEAERDEARAALAELLECMRKWGAEEDGVPKEFVPATKRAAEALRDGE